jgi:hypothetical protein
MWIDDVRYCDGCERTDITWWSCDDKNHLCEKHRSLQDTFKCGSEIKPE